MQGVDASIHRPVYHPQAAHYHHHRKTELESPSSQRTHPTASRFRQVLMCAGKGMNIEETAYAVGKTVRLVKEYFNIIDEYKSKNHVLEKILSYHPHVENNIELFINKYGKETE